jgi:type IV secretion system protein VirB9
MIRHLLISAVACVLGSGCATHAATASQGAPTQLVPAHPTVEAPAVVSVPPPPIAPAQRKEVAVPASINTAPAGLLNQPQNADALRAARIARLARLRATQVASTSTYVNAVAVYDYVPGQVYQVYTSPDYVTTISLKPGEKLISKVAGDTTRWVIGDTVTGDNSSSTVLVVLKPVRPNLRTNLMLSTNQRVYQIDLIALSGNQYQNAISWNYPQDAAREAEAKAAAMNAQAQQTELVGVAIEDLNDNYTVKSVQGRSPDWLPKHVFDDGKKTYIEFPPDLGTTNAPPLFVMGTNGKADLVNYRVKGHFYIVDRLFDRAQLRVGEDPQTIVELRRETKPVHTTGGPFAFLER